MAAVRRARGAYAKTADRRSEILDATMGVFSEAGFHGGTIRDIADRVGMSQAGLLHHFSSKQELLEAVLTHRDDLALARMIDGTEQATGARLLDALVDLSAYNTTTPGLVALYAVLSGEATAEDHPGNGYFRRRYQTVLGIIAEAVQTGQQRGDLRDDLDPRLAARMLVALWDGLQIQWLYEDQGFDMAGVLRAYVQSLLTAERAHPVVRDAEAAS